MRTIATAAKSSVATAQPQGLAALLPYEEAAVSLFLEAGTGRPTVYPAFRDQMASCCRETWRCDVSVRTQVETYL
jgi:hypothetical protein